MSQNRKSAIFVALLPAFITVVGCGEARVPVYPVTGTISYKGQPPVGALVVLTSISSGPEGFAPTATVKNDGSFEFTSYEPGDGAPQGEYIATVQWNKVVTNEGGSGPGPNVLPKVYASAKTSPLKVSVNGAPTQIPAIIIK